MTTPAEIQTWFEAGVEQGYAFMIVACDTFSWEDFPVYAADADEVRKKYAHYDALAMHKVMEVYDLNADMAQQLQENRVMRLPPPDA